MVRKKSRKVRSRKKRYSTSESESETESSDISSDTSSESESDLSSLSSSESESESDSDSSDSEAESADEFDDSVFPNENRRKTEEEVRELIRDAKVMKYESAVIDQAGIDNYESIRNCDERTLKRLGMGYSDRERLLKAFRNHIEGVIEKNRERWERKQDLKRDVKKKKSKKKGSKSKSKSRSKSSSSSKKKKGKSKSSSSSSSKKKKSKSKHKSKVDPEEALQKLDTKWSGKKQAWADYKQHEARVAELVEFYDEIGKKRANGEEHARRLLMSYPGGIHKLVIALDKKYHHIPYGWESLLDEALRLKEYSNSNSD